LMLHTVALSGGARNLPLLVSLFVGFD
jgi:hypothetical protein